MKKTTVLLLCLAFFSLACLETSAIVEIEPMITATISPVPGAVHVAEPTLTKVQTEGAAPQICAVVIAEKSLHLRNGPSENDIVLTWLDHGDLVQVVSDANVDWWLVRSGEFVGYARAKYLQERTCE